MQDKILTANNQYLLLAVSIVKIAFTASNSFLLLAVNRYSSGKRTLWGKLHFMRLPYPTIDDP